MVYNVIGDVDSRVVLINLFSSSPLLISIADFCDTIPKSRRKKERKEREKERKREIEDGNKRGRERERAYCEPLYSQTRVSSNLSALVKMSLIRSNRDGRASPRREVDGVLCVAVLADVVMGSIRMRSEMVSTYVSCASMMSSRLRVLSMAWQNVIQQFSST